MAASTVTPTATIEVDEFVENPYLTGEKTDAEGNVVFKRVIDLEWRLLSEYTFDAKGNCVSQKDYRVTLGDDGESITGTIPAGYVDTTFRADGTKEKVYCVTMDEEGKKQRLRKYCLMRKV